MLDGAALYVDDSGEVEELWAALELSMLLEIAAEELAIPELIDDEIAAE